LIKISYFSELYHNFFGITIFFECFFESEPARRAGERKDLGLSAEGGLSAGGAKPPPAEFHLVKFFFLDLWIKFGNMIEKA